VKLYSEFVLEYLYFRSVQISKPSTDVKRTFNYEHKYKVKIDVDYGDYLYEEELKYNGEPKKLLIEVFKDTTKNRLINFIEENWHEIEEYKKYLKAYPHTKLYGTFKRDVQVFILSLLGHKASEIGDILIQENHEDFSLSSNDIYQIINDFKLRIKQYNS
jgi:hypothetical protein